MILYAQIKGNDRNDLIKEKQIAYPEFKTKHPEIRKREKIKSGAFALRIRASAAEKR